MNIGVIGWWNNGNQGDFAILDNVMQVLAPQHVVPIDVPFLITPDEIARLNRLDFLIFGGGGLLTTSPAVPFDTFDAWGGELYTPIGIVGLGVDEVKPKHQRAVQQLLDRATFVYVRDTTSRQLLNHPKVQMMPDVTFFQPHTTTPQPVDPARPICGVNLRSLSPSDRQQWIATLQSLPLQLRGVPLATYSAFEELEILRAIHPQVSGTFTYDAYQALDLMIGTAFHSVIFAIQASVPVIAIGYAPKVERLMIELELGDYLLKTTEWHRLPALIERVVKEHDQIAARLREITAQLSQTTQQIMCTVKQNIESTAQPRVASSPRISIVLVGSDSTEATYLTLESCLKQTYPNTEITLVTTSQKQVTEAAVKQVLCADNASPAQRINLGLTQASGECLTWIKAGDCYALDAIAVLADRLQQEPARAVVYADFYSLREPRLIAFARSADEAGKLLRRNVVEPCFLFRRTLRDKLKLLDEHTVLPAYDFWLRAHQIEQLVPVHARLMYCWQPQGMPDDRAAERQTRRQWRKTQSLLRHTVGNIIDTDVVEAGVVQPLLKLRRRLKTRR
jgi:polysaccharide pyruvyl transferase WcaK-like protein